MSVDNHGKTNWAKGLKVVAELAGEERAYFLKVRTYSQHIPLQPCQVSRHTVPLEVV